MGNTNGNDINEAVQALSQDAILQKIKSIAITYSTKNGEVKTFSFLDAGENKYALIGMIEELKKEAFGHFETEDDDHD